MKSAAFLAVLGALTGLAVGAPQARADDAGPLFELVDAAARRLQVAEPVAAVKWATHGAIEDPVRVADELAELAADATAAGLDPAYVTRVFGDQIRATEAIEYSRFADWKLDPASVPAVPPDLSTSRAAIDQLNNLMLAQIAAHWDALHAPTCPAVLDAARAGAIAVHHLDGIYQRAVMAATAGYCQG
jgi:chorismate mutase